jgi:hypothetical protein
MTHPIAVSIAVLLAMSTSACTGDEGITSPVDTLPAISGYPIVGTDQGTWYDSRDVIAAPAAGAAFHGQNADYPGTSPSYRDNGDGTVTDLVTGLMWSQSPDTDGDGRIEATDKLTYAEAVSYTASYRAGGHSDWRLPTIKELYSLILFSGVDPSGYEGTSTASMVPFIDTDFFDFAYGDTDAGERIIDAQYASSTEYVDRTGGGDETLFGVNFADGRIKGYGLSLFGRDKTFFVLYVRGNPAYGINDFVDNGDGTITDQATGLMWMASDSGEGLNWQEALAYAESYEHAGYNDWRLPDVKELQSILDYTRSPGTTGTAAIDPLFASSVITNEAGEPDAPSYWSSTTHVNWSQVEGGYAAYVSFGRAMGYMNGWVDVHGAGAQRSDPKAGDPTDYPTGHGPQGDAIRIYNFVRLVRDR